MPHKGCCWWHLVLHTKGSWLHGDPRGFRTRHHRIHSSGDYRDTPPVGEHRGLHRHQREQLKQAIVIPKDLFGEVGRALVKKCRKSDTPLLAVSAGATHAHLLVELRDDYTRAEEYTRRLKIAGSHAIRHRMPGNVWARGGRPIAVRDLAHQRRVYRYILEHAEHGDWVWDFRQGEILT